MKNQAIKNDIERRIDRMNHFNFNNKRRLATIELLEEITQMIDFMQKQVQHSFKVIEFYKMYDMKATSKQKFHDWHIQKMMLTRLQERYRKVIELLYETR